MRKREMRERGGGGGEERERDEDREQGGSYQLILMVQFIDGVKQFNPFLFHTSNL